MAGIFHLAIPCRDVDEAARFYEQAIGARVARRYDDRVTLDFFGHQVVCHLAPAKIDPEPALYPRHFGFTFTDRQRYHEFMGALTEREVDVLREMAEGKNNAAIAQSLFLTERSVEKVIHSIFLKLGLGFETSVHKRVKAVILYLSEDH